VSGPTIGWRSVAWKGPKHRCQACNRRVREGVANIHNDSPTSPRFLVLCKGCYEMICETPAPPTWATPDWKGE
jgi:hypothetical protein